jgi:hypothetical protein
LEIFTELQRRNVFPVAIGYIVSCWLLAQVADLVLENIGAPSWVMQTILLVLILALGYFIWESRFAGIEPGPVLISSVTDG